MPSSRIHLKILAPCNTFHHGSNILYVVMCNITQYFFENQIKNEK